MSTPERPQLRASITGQLDPNDQAVVWLFDSSRISRQLLRVHRDAVPFLQLFTGQHTIRDMQAIVMRQSGGQLVPAQLFTNMGAKLDEALFLEGPRLQARLAEFLQAPIREPACIGSYEGEPEALRRQLQGLFTGERGPGALPADHPPDGQLPGALIPHIDFHRGGPTFAWGFKELIERSDATLFVIIGTSHYSAKRFTLTRKDFRTPLGVVPTDKDFVDRLATDYGNDVFADELAHLPEHSIEFQVVFLQHFLGDRRPFRIVPLVVGSFQDAIRSATPPHEQADIYLMIQALRRAEAESGERVCYIASGDLAHIGPKFGDGEPVHDAQLDWSRRQDHALLRRFESADLDGVFRLILDEQDARRTCGFPPTYTLMAALQPDRGKLLHYDQYVEPQGYESVSFASLAFYKSNGQH